MKLTEFSNGNKIIYNEDGTIDVYYIYTDIDSLNDIDNKPKSSIMNSLKKWLRPFKKLIKKLGSV